MADPIEQIRKDHDALRQMGVGKSEAKRIADEARRKVDRTINDRERQRR